MLSYIWVMKLSEEQIGWLIEEFKNMNMDSVEQQFESEMEYIKQIYTQISKEDRLEIMKLAERENNFIHTCDRLQIKLPDKDEQIGMPTYNPQIKGITINTKPKDPNKLNLEINELISQIDSLLQDGKISPEIVSSLKQDISFYYSYYESKSDEYRKIQEKEKNIQQYTIRNDFLKDISKVKKLVDNDAYLEHFRNFYYKYDENISAEENKERYQYQLNSLEVVKTLSSYVEKMSKYKAILQTPEQIAGEKLALLRQKLAQTPNRYQQEEIRQQINEIEYILTQINYDHEMTQLKANKPSDYIEQKRRLDKDFYSFENDYLERKVRFLQHKLTFGKMYPSEYQQEKQKLDEKIGLNDALLQQQETTSNSVKK